MEMYIRPFQVLSQKSIIQMSFLVAVVLYSVDFKHFHKLRYFVNLILKNIFFSH